MSKPRHKFFHLLRANPRRYGARALIFLGVIFTAFAVAYFAIPLLFATSYQNSPAAVSATSTPEKKEFAASHLPTPTPVKAIYMTQCVAGDVPLRNRLVDLIKQTELNSVVIDIKDYSGRLSFKPDDPALASSVSPNCSASDMPAFVAELHSKGIYVIGRITVFQDPYLAPLHPDWAVKRLSDKAALWKDKKGITYLDPNSRQVWQYIAALAKDAYGKGFDELNFDYIRFPSDGNMSDIYFPDSAAVLKANPKGGKAEVIKNFFAYLNENLKPTGAVLSADLFGMTTTNDDDLNIGQVLENALPYFDYVAPMVYPSHYPPHFMGFANPAEKPYEVVKFSMDSAVRRTVATTTLAVLGGVSPLASSTPPLYPKESFSAQKIRPWLQDFNLGAVYTASMVDKQIQAVYDAGLNSWMRWNASNHYTASALKSVDGLGLTR